MRTPLSSRQAIIRRFERALAAVSLAGSREASANLKTNLVLNGCSRASNEGKARVFRRAKVRTGCPASPRLREDPQVRPNSQRSEATSAFPDLSGLLERVPLTAHAQIRRFKFPGKLIGRSKIGGSWPRNCARSTRVQFVTPSRGRTHAALYKNDFCAGGAGRIDFDYAKPSLGQQHSPGIRSFQTV